MLQVIRVVENVSLCEIYLILMVLKSSENIDNHRDSQSVKR